MTDNNAGIMAPYVWTTVTLRGEGLEMYGSTTGGTHWKSHATLGGKARPGGRACRAV